MYYAVMNGIYSANILTLAHGALKGLALTVQPRTHFADASANHKLYFHSVAPYKIRGILITEANQLLFKSIVQSREYLGG